MKSTRERRERLFKHSRPFVRLFDPQTDMWVLWAAYDLGSFPAFKAGVAKDVFARFVVDFIASHSSCLVVEDDCKWFKAKRGPVCFVTVDNFGWRVEPKVDWFKWANPRMKLRCTAAFLQKTRYSSDVGVCVVRTLEPKLYEHMRAYGLLMPCGKIPGGDPKGDEYLFYVGGKRASHGTRRPDSVQRGNTDHGEAGAREERRSAVAERAEHPSEPQGAAADAAIPITADAAVNADEPESRRLRSGWGDPLPLGEHVRLGVR